ncbi:14031_t:CDS:2 [Funneliformis caledonium]|uniref:E3 ubiquitin-protein ligase n=1 Tax=Funneliformis caledonium TaxID=1117310 RepID=A0A9N8ZUZ4_9GLOM|nr:14031_t:CDS:2 [Funneliformis caledonium]
MEVVNFVNRFGTHAPVISVVIRFVIEIINIAREASQNNKQCKKLQNRLNAIYEILEVHTRHISDDYPFGKINTENLMRALDESRKFLLKFQKRGSKNFLKIFNSDEISKQIKELNDSLNEAQLGILHYISVSNVSNVNKNPIPQNPMPVTTESSSQDRTCGESLTLGEVYYHCRTCTTRNNSVLCNRCYSGTNHIGHDIITFNIMDPNMSVWCDCGDSEYWKFPLNCKFHSSNAHTSVTSHCGKKIAIKEIYYQCRTCTNRNDTVICNRCYAGSNHVGHDVISIANSYPGAWCDCGDSDYWRIPLNCKYHSQNGTSGTTGSRSHNTSSTSRNSSGTTGSTGSRSHNTSSTSRNSSGTTGSTGSRSHNTNSTSKNKYQTTSSTNKYQTSSTITPRNHTISYIARPRSHTGLAQLIVALCFVRVASTRQSIKDMMSTSTYPTLAMVVSVTVGIKVHGKYQSTVRIDLRVMI